MGAAGLRNARITIQTKTVTRTASGDETESWATLATVWARRQDVRGGENYGAQTLLEQNDVVFHIKYITGVTALTRVVHGSETFDVQRVVRVGGRNRDLELHCSSGVRDGR